MWYLEKVYLSTVAKYFVIFYNIDIKSLNLATRNL